MDCAAGSRGWNRHRRNPRDPQNRGGGGEEAPEGIMKNLIIFIGIIIYLEGGNHCVHCSQAHVAVREVGTGVSISGEGTTVQRLSNWCKAHS